MLNKIKIDTFIDILKKHETLTNITSITTTLRDNLAVKGLFGSGDYKIPFILGATEQTNTPIVLDLAAVNSTVLCGGTGGGKTWELAKILTHIAYFQPDATILLLDPKEDSLLTPFGKLDSCISANKTSMFIPLLKKLKELIDNAIANNTSHREVYLVIDEMNYLEYDLSEAECKELKKLLKYFLEIANKTDIPVNLHVILIPQRPLLKSLSKKDAQSIELVYSLNCSSDANEFFFKKKNLPELTAIGQALLKHKSEIHKVQLAALVAGSQDDFTNVITELLNIEKDDFDKLEHLINNRSN